jgi:hypothetical protein
LRVQAPPPEKENLLDSLLRVSQGENDGVDWAVFLPEGASIEEYPLLSFLMHEMKGCRDL